MKTALRSTALAFILIALTSISEAHADCPLQSDYAAPHTRTDFVKGGLVYDLTADVLKTCDGTNWNTVAAGSGLTGGTSGYLGVWSGATSMGLSSSTAGQQLFWDGTNHRLGIGTTAPDRTLYVGGTGLRAVAGAGYQSISVVKSSTYNSEGSAGIGIEDGTSDTGLLLGADAANDIAYIQSLDPSTAYGTRGLVFNAMGGNVGIGTTSPAAKLQVQDSGSGETTFAVNSTTAADREVAFTTNNSLRWIIGANGAVEGGSSAGSDLFINAYNDAGTYLSTGLFIKRNSGNVGIGTAGPTAKLHVVGGNIANSGMAAPGLIVAPTSGSSYIFGANTALAGAGLYDSTAGAWRIVAKDTSGFVGIGTTIPTAPLTVGTATAGGLIEIGATNGTAEGAQINWNGASTYDDWYMDVAANSFRIFTGSANANMVQIFNSSTGEAGLYVEGNVGIGTASPGAKLHLAGETTQFPNSLIISPTAHATSRRASMALDNWLLLQDAAGTGTKDFSIYDSDDAAHRFFIAANGGVGIGTAVAPVDTTTTTGRTSLTISGSSDIGVLEFTSGGVDADAGKLGQIQFTDKNSSAADKRTAIILAQQDGTTANLRGGALRFLTRANNTTGVALERMKIDQAGNVGIGVTNPSTKLDVAGSVKSQSLTAGGYGVQGSALTGTIFGILGYNNTWGVVCNGTSCGGNQAWTNYSDARLKERVHALSEKDGLDTIMRLRPVRFHWRDVGQDQAKGEQLGLIAQDVQKLLPEILGDPINSSIELPDGSKEEIKGTLNVSYATLVVPLIKAVQQLKAENDNLRAEIKTADDRDATDIRELREDLEALRASVGK